MPFAYFYIRVFIFYHVYNLGIIPFVTCYKYCFPVCIGFSILIMVFYYGTFLWSQLYLYFQL